MKLRDHDSAAAQFDHFRHQHQPIARNHGVPKAHVLESAKADHCGTEQVVLLRKIAAHLRGGFEHHNARHQRHIGHVTTDPELVERQILVADANLALQILKDDGGQLLHFEALGVVFSNLRGIGDDVIKVQCAGIEDQVSLHHDKDLRYTVFSFGYCATAKERLKSSPTPSNIARGTMLSTYLFAFGLAGLGVGGSAAVIGFLKFMMRLGHINYLMRI